ncbi:MAG: hydrogenase maturation protease [Actinomycetota bacterium]
MLVAGVGNVFLGDDGFGIEVARRLLEAGGFPEGVDIADFGIRGVHLAYQLLNGYEALVLIDAVRRNEQPGTVSVIEASVAPLSVHDAEEFALSGGAIVDGHGLDPGSVLALLHSLGGCVDRVFVVGCEPEYIGEEMGLSKTVLGAVEIAASTVREVVADLWQSAVVGASHRDGAKEEA